MRTTTDTLTGKAFRWNITCEAYDDQGRKVTVPARLTKTTSVHLHPSRVLPALLAQLNPEG
jgi:hypothetical protein